MAIMYPPPLGSLPYPGHQDAQGLVGCYLFNGSGQKVFDLTPNGLHLDGLEGFVQLASLEGNAGRFYEGAGSDTYLKTAVNIGSTVLSPANITVIARCAPGTGDSILVAAWRLGDANNQSFMLWYDSPVWEFLVRDSGGTAASANGTASGTFPTFETIVGTYDGINVKLYENGLQVDSDGTASGNLRSAGAYPLYVAINEGNHGSSTDHFSGWMSYIYIYDRALEPGQILDITMNPYRMFYEHDLDLFAAASPGGAPPVGNAAIMTTNTGFWGVTY